jgi:hypothetical protein
MQSDGEPLVHTTDRAGNMTQLQLFLRRDR